MQIFEKKGQIPAISKKRKPSEVCHGCKNAYFWKIQKEGPNDPPWGSESKRAKDLDQPKKNGTAFKKVGQKKVKNWPGGVNFENFEKIKKVVWDNVPRVICSKFESSRSCQKKTARDHRQTDRHTDTDGGDDNTWNAKFAFQVKRVIVIVWNPLNSISI